MAKGKSSNKKWLLIGAIVVIAAGVGIYFYVNSKKYKSGNKQKDDRKFMFKKG